MVRILTILAGAKLSATTRTEQLLSAVEQSQFPYLDSLIHLFVGGSEWPGAKVKNTDDPVIDGVYLEPPELRRGLDSQGFYVCSTAVSKSLSRTPASMRSFSRSQPCLSLIARERCHSA